MVDPGKLIEGCELELWQVVWKMHSGGVRYEVVHGILKEMTKTLEMQGYCEEWLKGYNPEGQIKPDE